MTLIIRLTDRGTNIVLTVVFQNTRKVRLKEGDCNTHKFYSDRKYLHIRPP